MRITTGKHSVRIGPHAVTRYHERVRAALSLARVHDEMRGVLPNGEVVIARPSWIVTCTSLADAWLQIGDDVAFPLLADETGKDDYFATTCVTKGTELDDHGVDRRRARKAKRRARRQDHYRKVTGDNDSRLGGGPRKIRTRR